MRRWYRRERYLGVARTVRAASRLAVPTDIIVGFPGETEADFADTLDLVERASFDAAFTFQYSPRPGTEPPPSPTRSRKRSLRNGSTAWSSSRPRSRRRRTVRRSAPTVEVLVEGDGKKDGSTQARTRTNRIVHVREPLPPGTFAHAEITEAGAHHLLGRIVPAPVHAVA